MSVSFEREILRLMTQLGGTTQLSDLVLTQSLAARLEKRPVFWGRDDSLRLWA
jgi:hypothetical protein